MLALITFLFVLSGFFFPLLEAALHEGWPLYYTFYTSLFWVIPLIFAAFLYRRSERPGKHHIFIIPAILMLLLYGLFSSTYASTWVYLPLSVAFGVLWLFLRWRNRYN